MPLAFLKTTAPTLEDAWRRRAPDGTPLNNFDALRLFAASLVLFFHSFQVAEGFEPPTLAFLKVAQISLGEFGVLTFFAISGFLITKSWRASQNVGSFFWKRGLRLLPALAVNVLVLTFLLGPLMTSLTPAAYFDSPMTWTFFANIGLIHADWRLPGVFDGAAIPHAVNPPLWSLPVEAGCYVLVAVLGATGRLKPAICLLALMGLVLLSTYPAVGDAGGFGRYVFRLGMVGPTFFGGALAALYADRIPLDGRLAALAAVIVAASLFMNGVLMIFAFAGVYVILYLAFAPLGPLARIGKHGDFSYGVYIWGWPIQQLVEASGFSGHWLSNLLIAAPLTFVVAAASWRFVEAPALRLKSQKPLFSTVAS